MIRWLNGSAAACASAAAASSLVSFAFLPLVCFFVLDESLLAISSTLRRSCSFIEVSAPIWPSALSARVRASPICCASSAFCCSRNVSWSETAASRSAVARCSSVRFASSSCSMPTLVSVSAVPAAELSSALAAAVWARAALMSLAPIANALSVVGFFACVTERFDKSPILPRSCSVSDRSAASSPSAVSARCRASASCFSSTATFDRSGDWLVAAPALRRAASSASATSTGAPVAAAEAVVLLDVDGADECVTSMPRCTTTVAGRGSFAAATSSSRVLTRSASVKFSRRASLS